MTEADWELMAQEALERLDLAVAKKSFIRIRNLKFLELLSRYEVIHYIFSFLNFYNFF